ncbi:RsmE family RNA methyltransferase [Pollutibacter soli]|uniref:RsmE family RNA methyltransferase n=1 Tax=Pollutibacter soli TaxID=3034157 RepID=UPI0030134CD2
MEPKAHAIPIFFLEQIPVQWNIVSLPDETARHILTVLRMRENEILQLTDGKGSKANAVIIKTGKKNLDVKIQSVSHTERPSKQLTLAVSLLKNASRFEWLLEKATELGVHKIVPLICARTERQHFRADRMKNILISAMIQSQQFWLPELQEPQAFDQFFKTGFPGRRYIAHCLPDATKQLRSFKPASQSEILIGPEGDFTEEEIELAINHGFEAVTLGDNRLRTETAAIAAVTLILLGQ